jgi:hypothetical protein
MQHFYTLRWFAAEKLSGYNYFLEFTDKTITFLFIQWAAERYQGFPLIVKTTASFLGNRETICFQSWLWKYQIRRPDQ